MKESEFRKILIRAKSDKISSNERRLLEQFLASRLDNAIPNDEIVKNSKQKALQNTLATIKFRKRSNNIRFILKYAAAVLIFLSVGYGIFNVTTKSKSENLAISYIEVSTSRGERKTVILPDSSTIVLNSNSYCMYPETFSKKQRLVQLKGEAFFDVQRNEEKPFIVKSHDFITTVLGTSFNINETNSFMSVTVSSGKVKVEKEDSKQPVILTKNRQFEYNYESSKGKVANVNAEDITNWSRGILQFDDITLEQAISEIEHCFNIIIEYSFDDTGQTIKGSYKDKSLEYVLEDMEFMLDISYTIKDDSVILSN